VKFLRVLLDGSLSAKLRPEFSFFSHIRRPFGADVSPIHPQESPLTPALKEFIDRAIVPALVKEYLNEIELANSDSDAAHSQRNTAAPELRTMSP
jgi:hypothetical protein